METGWASIESDQLRHLRSLAVDLGTTATVDEVARTTLNELLRIPGIVRAGLAVSHGAGRRLHFVSTDDDSLTTAVVRWCRIDGYADVPLVQATRHGHDLHFRDIEELRRHYPHMTDRQHRLGTRSLAALSLVGRDEPLGGLLLSYDREQPFGADERSFHSAFAAQVSQALRRAMAFEIQHTTSEQLQRSLMPHALPELDGISLGAHYHPGGLNVEVGGDWYDVLPLPDGSVVVSLGDVMGKGVPAAIVMSEVRSALRAYAHLDPAPGVVMTRLDAFVSSLTVVEQIVTAAYGLFSPDRRTLTLAVAGHPPPVLVSPSDRPVVLDVLEGTALGLCAMEGDWPETCLDLRPGSMILFYSDGLVEARDLDLSEGIRELVSHVTAMAPRRRNPRELCARLGELMHRDDTDDDVTVLAAAVTPAGGSRRVTSALPSDTTAPGLGRRFVRATLLGWGVAQETVDVAELCVSELVTNAIIHTTAPPQVTIQLDSGVVMVLVQDSGGQGTVRRDEDYDPLSVSGRGLTLIEALTAAWGADHNTDGTTVWFELEVSAGDPD